MRRIPFHAFWAVLVCLPLGAAASTRAEDPPPSVIPAARAKDHLGKQCTVELTVRASKNGTHHQTFYLDSEADFHDPRNLAVLISHDDARKFKKVGIEDPAAHYRGKTIRVTGKVIAEANQVRIRVNDPGQVKVVQPATP